jgi:hypothetical protein
MVSTIVDGKSTPHANGIIVFVDDQFVPEANVATTPSAAIAKIKK